MPEPGSFLHVNQRAVRALGSEVRMDVIHSLSMMMIFYIA